MTLTRDELLDHACRAAAALDRAGILATHAIVYQNDGQGVAIARTALPSFLEGLVPECANDTERDTLRELIEQWRVLPANKCPIVLGLGRTLAFYLYTSLEMS